MHTLANFWTFALLHLRKQSARPQPCLVLTLEVKFAHFLCMYICVCICAYCGCTILRLCVLCCLSFTQRMPPIYSQNRGFVVTPLKKLKSLSRQKQSAEAHKYLCGYGRRWQPFSYSHSTELKASVLVHEIFLFSPMGGALYHLAGDPEHLSPPKAEGNAP